MKFAPTLLIASVLGVAFASAQPIVDQELDRRNLVIATVYETVAAQVVKAAENPPVVVVTVTETAYGSPVAAAATSSAPASSATYVPVVTKQAVATPTPVAHSPQQIKPSVVAATVSSSAAAVATQASSSPSSSSSSGSSSSDWQNTMLSSLNSIRALAGKPALTLNSELSKIAQAHSAYQASANTMTHSDPSGELGSRLSTDGISWSGAAENIAWNQQDVAAVMLAWTNSAGHYANMIGDYTEVGFGVSDLYWTQDFIRA